MGIKKALIPHIPTILKLLHLFLAGLFLVFTLFAPWTKRQIIRPRDDGSGRNERVDIIHGVFDKLGGTGFGMIAVVLGIMLVLLAIMRLAGRDKVLPGLGVDQLTLILSFAATLNLFGFIVGWLALYPAGTGWGAWSGYFPVSMILQLSLLTLSAKEPAKGIKPLDSGKRTLISGVALLGGLGVAFLPLLAWVTSGPISLSGFEPTNGDIPSGPRLAYILLGLGAMIALAALMRLRPQGLAEPGPNLLLSHALFAAALPAFLLPLATLLSLSSVDRVNPGIGLWLGLIVGALLLGLALFENKTRGAVGA